MRKQIEQLIDQLADKSLTFGQEVEVLSKRGFLNQYIYVGPGRGKTHIIYSPELKEVHRCKKSQFDENYGHPILIPRILSLYPECDCAKLCSLWIKCGVEKSLQELAEDENAQDLFGFLATL